MRVQIVFPPAPAQHHGNRTTAERWAALLRELGHEVALSTEYAPRPDVLVAIHATKSAPSVERAARDGVPVVLLLAGTDLYGDLAGSRRAMSLATRVVTLQERALDLLDAQVARKTTVIHQSASVAERAHHIAPDRFVALVLAHLRPVKDPLRAAEAARLASPASRLLVVHAGAALDPHLRDLAEQEATANPRYRWLGERTHDEALALLRGSDVLVVSSRSEGGANVVSEALAAGTPILASRIDGTVGLLGPDYPGYFDTGDTRALHELLRAAEEDPSFMGALRDACARRAEIPDPAREREALRALLAGLPVSR